MCPHTHSMDQTSPMSPVVFQWGRGICAMTQAAVSPGQVNKLVIVHWGKISHMQTKKPVDYRPVSIDNNALCPNSQPQYELWINLWYCDWNFPPVCIIRVWLRALGSRSLISPYLLLNRKKQKLPFYCNTSAYLPNAVDDLLQTIAVKWLWHIFFYKCNNF